MRVSQQQYSDEKNMSQLHSHTKSSSCFSFSFSHEAPIWHVLSLPPT